MTNENKIDISKLSPEQARQIIKKATVEQSIEERLAEDEGFLKDLNESLKKVNGTVQQVDASLLSAGNAARKFFDLSNVLLGGIAEQIINYDESVRQAVTNNEKLVGVLINNRKAVMELGKETSRFGVATGQNLRVAREYGNQNLKLLSIYRDNIKGLVDYTARMSAFGVKTDDSIGVVNKLTTVLDMNGDQLDVSRRKLVSFANQTGQSVSEVMGSYSKSISSFMDFLNPDEMNKSFMQFQVMSRRMGTEANELYQMALKFDTLEGAQATGARLNQTFSALGIEFNSLAMQEMEPDERIRYMAGKTREALSRARTMGGKEGRLIMASLRDAGLGSNEMIRALEAEGGGRRATDFELGAPLQLMTREQEADTARRLNAAKVEAAEAEERALAAVMQTKSYELFEKSVQDFGGTILKLSDVVGPMKQAFLMTKAKSMDKVVGPALQMIYGVMSGTGEISPEGQKVAAQAGMNIKTFNELFSEINKLDPKKIETIFKEGGLITSMSKSFAKAVEDAIAAAKSLSQ